MSSIRLATRAVCAVSVAAAVGQFLLQPAHAQTAQVSNGPIAFSDGTHWIEVNPDGSDNGGRHIVTPSGGGYDPADGVLDVEFTADGTRVVFEAGNGKGFWTADADGTNAKRLTAAPPAGFSDGDPRVTADGQTVYFTRISPPDQTHPDGFDTVMEIPYAGGTASPVDLNGFTDTTYGEVNPVPSPDGRYLAYADARDGIVVVFDLITRQGTVVGNSFGGEQFSPDGKTLIVGGTDQKTHNGALIEYNEDGSGPGVTVPGSIGRAGGAAFAPDSTKIAMTTLDYDPGAGIGTTGAVVLLDAHTGAYLKEIDNEGPAHSIRSISWQNGPLYTGPVTPAPTPPPTTPPPTTPPPPAGGSGTKVYRDAGADRVQTGIAISQQRWGAGAAKAVVLATSLNFPDALSGGPLAAKKGGPLLLTDGSAQHLDPRVLAEIRRVLPGGGAIHVLGGDSAVTPAIVAELKAHGYAVTQYKGRDRADTALQVARDGMGSPQHVIVATGTGFADALAAGPYAAGPFADAPGAPAAIVLSDGAALAPATAAFLHGKTVATVGAQAGKAWPGAAKAFPGVDRFDTAARVAREFTGAFAATQVGIANGIASGTNPGYPDALTGGAFMAESHGPIVLVDGIDGIVPPASQQILAGHSNATRADIFGGTGIVSPALAATIVSLLHGTAQF